MEDGKKTLAVIIPNYNKGKFIVSTLRSIVEQTRVPDEIIIVDDCSKDNSREIIDLFKNKYPTLFKTFYLEENKGVQYCRNFGANAAKSEYICFVDSDDVYLTKDCIEKQMELVGRKKLVGVYQLCIDSNDKVLSNSLPDKIKRYYKRHPIYCFYTMQNFMPWPFHYILDKKEFIAVGGYDNPFSLYEDAEILLKLVLNNIKPVWLDIEGKGYRVDVNDDTHISHASEERLLKAKQYIWQKYKSALPLKTKIYMSYVNFMKAMKNKIRRKPKGE